MRWPAVPVVAPVGSNTGQTTPIQPQQGGIPGPTGPQGPQGPAGAGVAWMAETLAGTVNGSNTVFTSTFPPVSPGQILFKNNLETSAYTLVGNSWTMSSAPISDSQGTDALYAIYPYLP